MEARLERERVVNESNLRETMDPYYKAYMDYLRFESNRAETLRQRERKRNFRKHNPHVAYEHIRYIHLPINYTMSCLK